MIRTTVIPKSHGPAVPFSGLREKKPFLIPLKGYSSRMEFEFSAWSWLRTRSQPPPPRPSPERNLVGRDFLKVRSSSPAESAQIARIRSMRSESANDRRSSRNDRIICRSVRATFPFASAIMQLNRHRDGRGGFLSRACRRMRIPLQCRRADLTIVYGIEKITNAQSGSSEGLIQFDVSCPKFP